MKNTPLHEITNRSHANSYILYEVANSYELIWEIIHILRGGKFVWMTTPNPAPKHTSQTYKIIRVRSYKFVRISHLIKTHELVVR